MQIVLELNKKRVALIVIFMLAIVAGLYFSSKDPSNYSTSHAVPNYSNKCGTTYLTPVAVTYNNGSAWIATISTNTFYTSC